MKFFNLDSPLMQGLGKVADLMWLNILTVLCCLPVVTIGASLTAMNYMALKIARDEECYITKGFFKSFKENFRQATVIWLIMLMLIVILVVDLLILTGSGEAGLGEVRFGNVLKVIIAIVALIVAIEMIYVFAVLAKFENTVFRTMKNALLMSLMQLPKTIVMLAAYAAPSVLLVFVPQITPLCLLFGLSLPAWVSAKLYNKLFKRLEDQVMAENPEAGDSDTAEEDERIFKDELDPALADKDVVQ